MSTIGELDVQLAIHRFLSTQPFYPCCLLVHPEIDRLERIALYLVSHYGWPRLALGAVLSEQLLPIAPERRSGETYELLRRAIQERVPGPVLCMGIDILFEPSLALDPLRLLLDASRIVPLVVTWPGSYHADLLAYAQSDPPHAHYCAWNGLDLCQDCIITL